MSFGAVMRSYDEVITFHSRWVIGASGAHTKAAGVAGSGFRSVARNVAGKYTVTLSDPPVGPIVDVKLTHWPADAAAPKNLRPTVSSYDPSAKTLKYEAWSVGTTPALAELASGDQVSIEVVFQKTR